MALSFLSPLLVVVPAAKTLCTRCASLNLDDAFRLQPQDTVRILAIYDTLVLSGCDMCSFLSRSLGALPANAPYELLAVQIGPSTTKLLHLANASILCLHPFQDRLPRRRYFMFDNESSIIYDRDSEARHMLKPIPPLVDMAIVKDWLGFCFNSHSRRCCTMEPTTDAFA
jgi:hypothetical protein